MADNARSGDENSDKTSGSSAQYDIAPGATPVAARGASSAFGRTAEDLATDRPAGHASPDLGSQETLPGAKDVTGGWGPTGVDPDTGGDIRRGRPRALQPEVDPDARLGLSPVTHADDFPDPPLPAAADTRSRVATGALAGLIAAMLVASLLYAIFWAGVAAAPGFVLVERQLLGLGGWLDHVVGLSGFLIVNTLWGGLFGLLVARPTFLKGVAFGVLPTLVHWLLAYATHPGSRMEWTGSAIGLPLLYHALIWGGLLGMLSGRWLGAPSATATTRRTNAGA